MNRIYIDVVFYTDLISAWDLSKDEITDVEQAVDNSIEDTNSESTSASEQNDTINIIDEEEKQEGETPEETDSEIEIIEI